VHGARGQRLLAQVGHGGLNGGTARVVSLDHDDRRRVRAGERLLEMLQRRDPREARRQIVHTGVVHLEVQRRRGDRQQHCQRDRRCRRRPREHPSQERVPDAGLLPLGRLLAERHPDATLVDVTAEQRQGCR
jgi:hypothetical protein